MKSDVPGFVCGFKPNLFLVLLSALSLICCVQTLAQAAEVPSATKEQLEGWAHDLGADDFQRREEAQKHLASVGIAAVPVLREAVKSDDPEVRLRAEKLLAPLVRSDRLDDAAQALGDHDWERVSAAIEILLERCDEQSQQAVAQAASGSDRAGAMARVLLKEMEKVRMSDAEIARMVEMGKNNPAIRQVVERKMGEVQRVYRQRAYESCLKEFERLKSEAPATKP